MQSFAPWDNYYAGNEPIRQGVDVSDMGGNELRGNFGDEVIAGGFLAKDPTLFSPSR